MLKEIINLIKFYKNLNKDSIVFFSEFRNYANYFKNIIDNLTYIHKKSKLITFDVFDNSFHDNKNAKVTLKNRLLQIIFFNL